MRKNILLLSTFLVLFNVSAGAMASWMLSHRTEHSWSGKIPREKSGSKRG